MKDPPSYLDRVATQSDWTNWAASGEGQVYMSNTRKLIRAWVVLIEGKRMSDADARVNEMMRSFRPGDDELADEDKKATLKDMAESIRALGETGVRLPVPGEKPSAKSMSAEAYQAARRAGYTDAEIQAQGYAIPRAP